MSAYLIVATALVLMERSAGINSPGESLSLLARSSLIVGPLSMLLVLLACFLCLKVVGSPFIRTALVLLNLIGIVCAATAVYWAYPLAAKNVQGIGI